MKLAAAFAWRVMLMFAMIQGANALGEGEPLHEPPLHELIDRSLPSQGGVADSSCSDADFLRRVSLDLVGMPPTADEARAFIADPSPAKRVELIDRLFATPHFTRHLAATLDLWLMERRVNTHVTADEWQSWLVKSVRENKPWNVLVREILLATGEDPAQRAPARFALDRGSDPHMLTRDIGRIFFGRDMQCAQCHDHPVVADYLQSDYHGLLAFVSPSYGVIRTEGDKQRTLQAEKAGTELAFESVFVGVPHRTGPRVPGEVAIDEPSFLPGEEYEIAPADGVVSVPKFSRRAKLADLATGGGNEEFNRNIVNRLWAHMFGRGLVHPLDMQHPDNAGVNPELLSTLSERFAAMSYDIRAFLRELAMTSAYQRPFDPPQEVLALAAHARASLTSTHQQLEEAKQRAEASSEAYSRAAEAWQDAESAYLPAAGELDAARTQYAAARTKMSEAQKAEADAKAALEAKLSGAELLSRAAAAAAEAGATLQEGKDLGDVSAALKTRSEQLAAELDALRKSVGEKVAAIAAPAEEVSAALKGVEATALEAAPLKAAEREAEKAHLAARLAAAQDAEQLAALERRLETTMRVAQLTPLSEAVGAAQSDIARAEGELAAAEQRVTEFMEIVAAHDSGVKLAEEKVAAMGLALASVQGAQSNRLQAAESIAKAVESVTVAQRLLPADLTLADTSAKLQERLTVVQGEMGEVQNQLAAAAAARKSAQEELDAARSALGAATAERASRENAVAAARESLLSAQSACAAKQAELDSAIADVVDRWTNDFQLATLKPLTPEQLCWTVFRVTGVYDRYWQTEVAELDKTSPLTDEQKGDPAQVAARDGEIEQRTYDKLKGNVGTFVAFYGAAAGQPQGDFFSTADQALFAANGGAINAWVVPGGDNVTERIIKQTDSRVAAEELYLSVLTRFPSEEEVAAVTDYLAGRSSDRAMAAQELVWGLLNSAEFRFNH